MTTIANARLPVVLLSSLSAEEAAELLARLARTSRACYAAALEALVEHVPWGVDGPDKTPAHTLREYVRRVIFVFVKDSAHAHPTPPYTRDHRFDQARIWALRVVQPWAAHLRLPVPFVREDPKEGDLRIMPRTSFSRTAEDRQMARDELAMANALDFLVRDVPLAWTDILGWDRWTKWHVQYAETPEEYATRIHGRIDHSWCRRGKGQSQKAHELELCRVHTRDLKVRKKSSTQYARRRERTYDRLPVQSARHVRVRTVYSNPANLHIPALY